jgi:hypothetical protein
MSCDPTANGHLNKNYQMQIAKTLMIFSLFFLFLQFARLVAKNKKACPETG